MRHPELEAVSRLLAIAPTIPNLDMAVDGVRIVAARQALTAIAEEAVERLIGLLDELAGDADLEEDDAPEDDDPAEDGGDDENSLGWTERESNPLNAGCGRVLTDADDDLEIGEGDDEPSLGWPEAKRLREYDEITGELLFDGMDQSRNRHVDLDDLEAEHDGREPEAA